MGPQRNILERLHEIVQQNLFIGHPSVLSDNDCSTSYGNEIVEAKPSGNISKTSETWSTARFSELRLQQVPVHIYLYMFVFV